MDIQRLRNLTTGRLHTKMGDIYKDLGLLTGEKALMTHMLPRALDAVKPWLIENVKDVRFWDGEYDTTHTGEIDLPETTNADKKLFLERFSAMPSPFEGKS